MRWKVFLVTAPLLLATSLPTAAQINVDMNHMTCGDWLGYSRENQDFVRFWMSGYYNAAADIKVMSYDRMQRNSAKVAAYCKKHKSDPLPKAINKLRGLPANTVAESADRRIVLEKNPVGVAGFVARRSRH